MVFNKGSSDQNCETIGFGQETAIFYTIFFFQIYISITITVWGCSAKLVRKPRRKFRQRSIGWSERDVSVKWMRWSLDNIFGSLVKQVIFPPLQRVSLGYEGLGYNWKESMRSICSPLQQSRGQRLSALTNTFKSKVSRDLDKPSPNSSVRITRGLSWPWVE